MTNEIVGGGLAESALIATTKIILGMIFSYGPGIIIAFLSTAWAKHAFPLTGRGKKIVLPIFSIASGIGYRFAVVVGAMVIDTNSPKPIFNSWFIALELVRGIGLGIAASFFYMLIGWRVEKWLVSKIKRDKG